MPTPIDHIVVLFQQYKYLLIFPVAVVEGPIIMVISGFLVSLGLLNGYLTYIVLVFGDLVGDALHYVLGKYSGNSIRIRKYAKFFGYNESSEKFLEDHFRRHKGKTFILAKLSHGIGGAVQVAAGIAKVDFLQFLLFNFIGTIPKTLIFFLIGYYLGGSYKQIDIYLSSVAFVTIGISLTLIISYIILSKFSKKFFNQ